MSAIRKILTLLIIVLLIAPLAVGGYALHVFKKMYDPSLSNNTMNDFSHTHVDGIRNILVLGTDARPGDKVSRTDSMMILTIDTIHKDIKLTSLARDTFVDIPGHGYSKLTHAYAFGKEELLAKTIEHNFGIDINDFVLFNFESFMSIIDSVGGIEVDINKGEMDEMNKFIPENYKWDENKNKGQLQLITHTGRQTVNGYQALSYARIRHNDNAFMRDGRQRIIIMSLMKKIESMPKYKYPFILDDASKYIKTNIKPSEMLKIAIDVVKIGPSNIKQMEFPIVSNPNLSFGGIYGKYGWVLRYKDSSVNYLKDFIFNDIVYGKNSK